MLDIQRQINNCIASLACGIFKKKKIKFRETKSRKLVARSWVG